MDFYAPSRTNHGSYWYDWTTDDEVAWRNFYQVWFRLVNDYKKMGGRVTTGSDSGFIYQTYGFGYINELEMLQEAGFHPLEVIQAATMNGAMTLYEPQKQADRVRRRPRRHAGRHGDRRSEPAAELQGALRHRRAAAQRQDRQAPSGSAASSTRSRTASSTTRSSCSPRWRRWSRSRRRSGRENDDADGVWPLSCSTLIRVRTWPAFRRQS